MDDPHDPMADAYNHGIGRPPDGPHEPPPPAWEFWIGLTAVLMMLAMLAMT